MNQSNARFPKPFFFVFALMTLLAIPSVREGVVKFLKDRLLPLVQEGKNNDDGSSGSKESGPEEDDFTIRLN